jgi:hypothetical protein
VKSTYPAWGYRCCARSEDCQPHSLLTALVAGAMVARGTGAPLSGTRDDRSGLQPWPAHSDASVWASPSLGWARAAATVGMDRRAANSSYRRRERGPVAGVSPVCPENPKLFIRLTFFEFLFMLEQRTPPCPSRKPEAIDILDFFRSCPHPSSMHFDSFHRSSC